MPILDYYSDEEVEMQIEEARLNIDKPIDFKLKDVDIIESNFGGQQFKVTLEISQNNIKHFDVIDYFNINAKGYSLFRFKSFLKSINAISMYENREDIAPYSLLSKTRTGKLMGQYLKKEGYANPLLRVKEYIYEDVQQDDNEDIEDEIPF